MRTYGEINEFLSKWLEALVFLTAKGNRQKCRPHTSSPPLQALPGPADPVTEFPEVVYLLSGLPTPWVAFQSLHWKDDENTDRKRTMDASGLWKSLVGSACLRLCRKGRNTNV